MYTTIQNRKLSRVIPLHNKRTLNNGSKSPIQRYHAIQAGFPDYDYLVDRNDINRGKETNSETRDYVNNMGYNGGSIYLKYETSCSPVNIFSVHAKEASIPNPRIYIPGRCFWDAGHALAKTLGGDGTSTKHVFPQSPPVNQGNRNHMYQIIPGIRNYQLWRNHEETFKRDVDSKGCGRWYVHVS